MKGKPSPNEFSHAALEAEPRSGSSDRLDFWFLVADNSDNLYRVRLSR